MPCPPRIQRAGAHINTYNKPCAHEPIVSRSPREVQLREHRPAHRCRRVPTDWRVHRGVPRVRLASTSAIALARAALRCAAHSFGCACRRRKHCARRREPSDGARLGEPSESAAADGEGVGPTAAPAERHRSFRAALSAFAAARDRQTAKLRLQPGSFRLSHAVRKRKASLRKVCSKRFRRECERKRWACLSAAQQPKPHEFAATSPLLRMLRCAWGRAFRGTQPLQRCREPLLQQKSTEPVAVCGQPAGCGVDWRRAA
jgi:hypothetical protein